MPHPDDGMIHAWLDGELDAAESARVEALIASDQAWSAAAAEARGLIAASSRITRALDHVPAQVAPKRSPANGGRSRRWWTVRVAALLVVVAGTTLVLRDGGPERALQVAAEPGGEPPVAKVPLDAATTAPVGQEPKSPERSLAASAPPLPGSAVGSRAENAAPQRVAAVEKSSTAAAPPSVRALASPAASVAAAGPAEVRDEKVGAPSADSSVHLLMARSLATEQEVVASAGAARRQEARAAGNAVASATESAAKSSAKMTDSPAPTRCFELREPLAFAGRTVRHPPDSLSLANWQLLVVRPDQLIERGDSLLSKPGADRLVVAVRVSCPPKP